MTNNVRNHVVITGTGRAGTTFLVQLLTNLGLQTGFNESDMKIDENAKAGLELDIRDDNVPYIVKSPLFCDYVDEIVSRKDIIIDYLIVPIRDVEAAAKSRLSVYKKTPLLKRLTTKPSYIHGGMWDAFTKKKQQQVLVQKLYKLLFSISELEVPVILIKYPMLINNSKYLFNKLKPILNDLTYEKFKSIYELTVRPELVHKFSTNDK